MKYILCLFYDKLFNDYFYNQNYDEETAKKYSYIAVRNVIGGSVFMFFVVFFIVVTCVFKINVDIKTNRPLAYLIMAILTFSYIKFTKKKLKPMFRTIKLKKEKPTKNYFFLFSVCLFSLFCGGMFVIARLLNFYLCK